MMRMPGAPAAGDEGWEFAAGTLPERTVERAHVLMEVREASGVALVVLDAVRSEFVRLPPTPGLDPIALAADGRSILLGRRGTLVRMYLDGRVQEFADGFPYWTVIDRRKYCEIFMPGGSWAGPRDLLYYHEWADDDLVLLSLDGTEEPLRTGYGGVSGVHARRLIVPSDREPVLAEVFTTTLTGQDRRPFIRAHGPPGSSPPRLVDIAPGLTLP